MNATASLPPEAAAYLEEVRSALSDLPAEERDELLADVEVSLVEAAEDGRPLAAGLGEPQRFATELRAAAGLAPPALPATAGAGMLERGRGVYLRLRTHPLVREARHEFAGAWWIARGYLAVVAIAHVRAAPWSGTYPGVPWLGGPPAMTVGLLAAAIAASVWLGLYTRRHPARRRWLVAVNLVVLLALVPLVSRVSDGAWVQTVYVGPGPVSDSVTHLGEPVRNIYPYSRAGRMLFDVLLYDDLGRPLDVGSPQPAEDPLRRRVFDRSGDPVVNAYPIRYREPGTAEIQDPTAGPAVTLPDIATPPVQSPRPRR